MRNFANRTMSKIDQFSETENLGEPTSKTCSRPVPERGPEVVRPKNRKKNFSRSRPPPPRFSVPLGRGAFFRHCDLEPPLR